MHCELLVPALVPSQAQRDMLAALRLPALELLLGRGRMASEERRSTERWLADAFDLGQNALPAAALTMLGDGADPGDAVWLRADPVHLQLMRDDLRLIPSAGFMLSRNEAEALCETLNAHYVDEMVIYPLHPERWCLRLPGGDTELEAPAPLEIAGKSVDSHLPGGRDATHWHAILNEMQMLLAVHPVNEAREKRGEPPVNSVWLWGGGRCPGKVARPWHSLSADDPLALGLARHAEIKHGPLATSAPAWFERLPEDGHYLAMLDVLRAAHALGDAETYRARLQALEADWFGPLLAALRAGKVDMVTIRVPDASEALSFETVRSDLRYFWRRARPIGDYA